ncbi:MAG: ABC transporter ATP-binding protein [Actinobacteria bacterium]|jgi:putative ABC transport system ATP-binding protein|nr:ABC transporter ATP-binding protein [Actinomycetota bacterium]NBR66838.1 ABC transporter ATP-binding protein [Actinomycetota bacterium]NBU16996.1 ABC transporter ATP-binding protein [Actinomycetota bacterium]
MAFVQCSGLRKTYTVGDEEVRALDNVSITVEKGDFIAICGPSGSGKSTLANVIGGLDQPDEGSVLVDGVDLAKAKDKELSEYRNSRIGFVFQSFNLQAHETALENVISPLVIGGVGKKKERRERGMKALERVGLSDRAGHKPTQLSGGQRQRVAIARALVNDPQMIIADEPTGNLDSSRGSDVIAELRRLNSEGITLIIITHDPNVAAQAKRVVEIKDGKITERTGAR